MSEDPRISEIRAVLDGCTDGALCRCPVRIRAILDRPAPAPEQWQADARIREQRATALGYCEHIVEVLSDGEEETCSELRERGSLHCAEHASAPRVFFPGDLVPAGVQVMIPIGAVISVAAGPWRVSKSNGPAVEITATVLSPEEWQAAVDRARDTRADATWAHTEGTNP
ncbi:hypothetical protein [Amycolatopsis sp. cmx-4-83]|uniref:hypothetical protein n=1 Tax=Amycolatopsis sp. cmx-4-83 TaxID=2790940 RepID=UPI0039789EEE